MGISNFKRLMILAILASLVAAVGCGDRKSRTRIRKNLSAKPTANLDATKKKEAALGDNADQGNQQIEQIVDKKAAEQTQANMEKLTQALDLEMANQTNVRPESFVNGQYQLEEITAVYKFADEGVGALRKVSVAGNVLNENGNPFSFGLLDDTEAPLLMKLPANFEVNNQINSPFKPQENMAGQKTLKSTYDNMKKAIQLEISDTMDANAISLMGLLNGQAGTLLHKDDIAYQSMVGQKILTLRALKSNDSATLKLVLNVDEKADAKNEEIGRSRTFIFSFRVTQVDEQELATAMGTLEKVSGTKTEME